EARELNAKGLRYGAMIRYLEASRRIAMLRSKPIDRAEIAKKLIELEPRIMRSATDHTIAQVFLESAHADLASAASDGSVASAIATYTLPRYFAAIEPARPRKTVPA